jgi:hypothetical protein
LEGALGRRPSQNAPTEHRRKASPNAGLATGLRDAGLGPSPSAADPEVVVIIEEQVCGLRSS